MTNLHHYYSAVKSEHRGERHSNLISVDWAAPAPSNDTKTNFDEERNAHQGEGGAINVKNQAHEIELELRRASGVTTVNDTSVTTGTHILRQRLSRLTSPIHPSLPFKMPRVESVEHRKSSTATKRTIRDELKRLTSKALKGCQSEKASMNQTQAFPGRYRG